MRAYGSRLLFLCSVVLLTAMAVVQLASLRHEVQTWDEGFEIASGFSYLKTGDYRISPEQPPLARILAAVPLLWLDPMVPVDDPSWANRDDRSFGHEFLYRNRVAPDDIVLAARVPTVVTTFVLGIVLVWWARRMFGTQAALGCLLLFAFDPNLIAVGRYVKNDMLVTLLSLVCFITWVEYLRTGRRLRLWLAGLLFGLALGAKFSAVFLIPTFGLTWIIARRHARRSFAPTHCAAAVAVMCSIAVLVLFGVYAPAWRKLVPATRAYRAAHPEAIRLADGIHVSTRTATAFTRAATHLGVQDHPLFVGLARFIDHSSGGHDAYLFGRISNTGWWYYLPVAFVLKSPIATVTAIVLALLFAVRRLLTTGQAGTVRRIRVEWLFCAAPIVAYLGLTFTNRVNTGERHLFPIYPFAFVLTSAILSRTTFPRCKWIPASLAILLAVESASVYPHYLAFFNRAVGGPSAGARYLVDSNLDWGQDLLYLRDYWIERGRPPLCLDYFGTADVDYYTLPHDWVPRTHQTTERAEANCLAAVSATDLVGVYTDPDRYRWLREREPVAKIGYSIYVYDLLREAPATASEPRPFAAR